ncbi:hypothetical protein FRC08_001717 [Ceratobasidium sp. 394]|nr:hypothetical protein FRC08_001717 [Ceratobasidium sp. 394]
MIEPFNHASGVDASSDDFTHSHFRCLSGGDPLMAHSALQPAFPVPATRVSDPQAGLVGLASKHSVDAEHAASGSATSFRRRSGRSHNRDLAISNPTQTRTRSSTASASRDVTPSHVVSSSYRQLSEKEIKNLNLDPDRRHYKCLVDGCERVFGRKSNVENHIRTHLDDKPFVCSLGTCKAAFVRKGDLQRHEQIHRPSRSHMCSCGQTFSRNDALMKHIRKGICGPNGSSVFL